MQINTASPSLQKTTAVQPQAQASRAKEVENDKDKDDGASKVATQAAPRPTVNTSGQVVGSFINTQA